MATSKGKIEKKAMLQIFSQSMTKKKPAGPIWGGNSGVLTTPPRTVDAFPI